MPECVVVTGNEGNIRELVIISTILQIKVELVIISTSGYHQHNLVNEGNISDQVIISAIL